MWQFLIGLSALTLPPSLIYFTYRMGIYSVRHNLEAIEGLKQRGYSSPELETLEKDSHDFLNSVFKNP